MPSEPDPTSTTRRTAAYDTANERFKRHFGDWFWGSLVVAAAVHFLAFAFWPSMSTALLPGGHDALIAVDIPPRIDIPPPPEPIARPATPVVGDVFLDDALTIAPTTFPANPVEALRPPPAARAALDDAPQWTPMTVEPRLINRDDIQQLLKREYPAHLRAAGIGGTPLVWFRIDEDGRVIDTRLNRSSGHAALDRAALDIGRAMRFSPAEHRGRPVAVWIALDVVFLAR